MVGLWWWVEGDNVKGITIVLRLSVGLYRDLELITFTRGLVVSQDKMMAKIAPDLKRVNYCE